MGAAPKHAVAAAANRNPKRTSATLSHVSRQLCAARQRSSVALLTRHLRALFFGDGTSFKCGMKRFDVAHH